MLNGKITNCVFVIFFIFQCFIDFIINKSLINSDKAIEKGIANISNFDIVIIKDKIPIELLINNILAKVFFPLLIQSSIDCPKYKQSQ